MSISAIRNCIQLLWQIERGRKLLLTDVNSSSINTRRRRRQPKKQMNFCLTFLQFNSCATAAKRAFDEFLIWKHFLSSLRPRTSSSASDAEAPVAGNLTAPSVGGAVIVLVLKSSEREKSRPKAEEDPTSSSAAEEASFSNHSTGFNCEPRKLFVDISDKW